MTWYDSGWSDADGKSGNGGGSSSGGGGGGYRGPMIFRLRLPYGMGTGRDILYLDDDPFRFWEHNGRDPESNKWTRYGVCRNRNNIGDKVCSVCDEIDKHRDSDGKSKAPLNLYNVGVLSAIDISFAVGKEYRGNRNFYLMEKRIVPAKRGSQDYPGALADLHRIREREGRLRGIDLHQLRKGKLSPTIGDSFEVIDRIEPNDDAIMEYLKERVRRMIKSGAIKTTCEEKGVGVPNKEFYIEKMKELDLAPVNYSEMFQPMSAVELANHFNIAWTPPAQQSMLDDPASDAQEDPFSYEDGPPQTEGGGSPSDDMPF